VAEMANVSLLCFIAATSFLLSEAVPGKSNPISLLDDYKRLVVKFGLASSNINGCCSYDIFLAATPSFILEDRNSLYKYL